VWEQCGRGSGRGRGIGEEGERGSGGKCRREASVKGVGGWGGRGEEEMDTDGAFCRHGDSSEERAEETGGGWRP